MDYESYYKRILGNIEEKAPIESGVQTLVYMLVFDILKDEKKLDAVIIDRLQKDSDFMSYGGISDIAIVDKEFSFNGNDRTKIKMCIEVKAIGENINNKVHQMQVKKQLLTYQKAIITNGKNWAFYELHEDFCTSNEKKNVIENINKVVGLERELACARRALRGLYTLRTNLRKQNKDIGEVEKQIQDGISKINVLLGNIIELEKDIDNKISYNKIQPTDSKCLEINSEESLETLREKLSYFIGVKKMESSTLK